MSQAASRDARPGASSLPRSAPWRRIAPAALALVPALLAGLPLAGWLWGRWFSQGGEPFSAAIFLGVLAAQACLLWGDMDGEEKRPDSIWLALSAAALAASAILYGAAPRLIAALAWALGLSLAMLSTLSPGARARSWGLVPLAVFSMPLSASLQFVFGYPLRVASGEIAEFVLAGAAERTGASLTDGLRIVAIDAPCSGIKMFSVSIVLASAAALALGLRPVRTVLLLAAAAGLAVFGNAARSACLFLAETGGTRDLGVHELVGIAVFAFCAAALSALAYFLKWGQSAPAPRSGGNRGRGLATPLFLCACLLAGLAPLVSGSGDKLAAGRGKVFWPKSFMGRELIEVPLDAKSLAFLDRFPGDMAQFRLGDTGAVVLLRSVSGPTRKLHPAEDCYRGIGMEVAPGPLRVDDGGRAWSGFIATDNDGARREVRQLYFEADLAKPSDSLEDLMAGARWWSTASAWYWAASMPGSGAGPTLAVTISAPASLNIFPE